VAAAATTLQAGFTTIRDLGTEGAGSVDVGLRDAIALGIVPGPRMFTATRAIVATGAYGPQGFAPRWDLPRGAQVADGVEGIRRAVREQIAAGADWIKLYADYRRRPGAPATPTFTEEELAAAVHEARSAGVPAVAHASTAEGIRRAVLAGVETIEHGSGADLETLVLLRERSVVLCPTLAAAEAIARYAGGTEGDPEHPRITQSRTLVQRALEAGVTLACGSDAGVFAHGENARELELLVEYGLDPAAALAAATTVAARVLHAEGELGVIAPGARADLVAVRRDPRVSPVALREPPWVVQDGRVVVEPDSR
jgi:imidazolonepropionase-like amidohydrolase